MFFGPIGYLSFLHAVVISGINLYAWSSQQLLGINIHILKMRKLRFREFK